MVPNGEASWCVILRWWHLLDRLALAQTPARRGRPVRYDERVFLKGVVLLVVRQLPSVQALLALLDEPELAALRAELVDAHGRFPSRRTWERRLGRVPDQLPAQIAAIGRHVVVWLHLWEDDGQAVALDSTPLQARGKVWHQRQRRAGRRPDTRIDPEAPWCHSGWHGWTYGYKLHLLLTVCPLVGIWLPLSAAVTPANVADSAQAPAVLAPLGELGAVAGLDHLKVLADSAYAYARVRAACARAGCTLVASHRGGPRPPDDGTAVRQVFHAERSLAIESWNSQFKHIFDLSGQLPTRGLQATTRFVLGAVLVYQLTVLDHFLLGRSLRAGLQAAIQAA